MAVRQQAGLRNASRMSARRSHRTRSRRKRCSQAVGAAAVRGLSWQVLFRAASRRTGHDGFPVIRPTSDYGVSGLAGGSEWMRSWQMSQATTVLRRR